MGCTPEAVVCDDTGPGAGPWDVLLGVTVAGVVVVLLVLAAVLLLRRRIPRQPPVTRVWVSADGDVVRRASGA